MGPWYHRLCYFVADAWDECRHSPGVNLLAVGTLSATLFLAAVPVLAISNLERRVRQLEREVRIEVYLEDGIDEGQRAALERRLGTLEGILAVEYVSKDEALRRYATWAGEQARLAQELDTNPLPASFELTPDPRLGVEPLGEAVREAVGSAAGVEDLRFDRAWLRRLDDLLALARIGGTVVAVPILAALVFVIGAVLRLVVHSRREEIEIVTLVGATRAFVWGPFLVAGLAQALVSGALALLAVEVVRRGILAYARGGALAVLEQLVQRSLSPSASLGLVAIGVLVGTASSYFAVRRGQA